MGMMVKMGIPMVLMSFAASYLDIVTDLLNTVRKSVVGIELTKIDDALQRELVMSTERGRDPLPADREGFYDFLKGAFQDTGRDVTRDQFGEQYYYEHPERTQAYSIVSAGPDRELGNDDDLMLERDGETRRMNHSPEDIAKAMGAEIEKERERKKEQMEQLEGELSAGDDGGEAPTGLVDSVTDLLGEIRGSLFGSSGGSGAGGSGGAGPSSGTGGGDDSADDGLDGLGAGGN